MDVQQNFHVPILSSGDAKTISDENQCCQNEVQAISGNSKSVKILEEFKRIYLERLRKIEEETPEEGAELKLKTLTSWINDLGEQNLMLVETVEQLEQEAADRVMLLEERLKKSSHIALEYLSKLEEYDNQLLNQANEKDQPMMLPIKTSNRLMQAQQTEEILKTRISNLQNDISGLLELIRRARYEGSWDTNGLSFLEVTYEDIFGLYPHQVRAYNCKGFICGMFEILSAALHVSDNLESASHLQTTKSVSQQKVARALEDNIFKDQGMKLQPGSSTCPSPAIGHLEKAEELQSSSYGSPKEISLGKEMLDVDTSKGTRVQTDNESLKQRITGSSPEEMEISTLNRKAEHTAAQLRRLIEENQRLIKENKLLSINLKNKSDKIALLAQHLTEVDESLKRTKESMIAEVTEKNEQLLTVRQSMLRLEKYVIQADMQTHFKNAIIKEMRKDIKEAKSKKKGVSFASPTKDDYRLQIQDLQTPLKQAQNGVELARKQDAQHCGCQSERVALARQVEESRVNVVLAQAAIEETVEELDAVADILREREEKIRELEAEIQCLQHTLIHSQEDIDVFLQPVICDASQRGLQINNFEDKLQRLSSAMKDSQKNIEDYIRDKETSYNSQKQSEQKIKKLQLELESIQEDLEQCLKTFEPSEV